MCVCIRVVKHVCNINLIHLMYFINDRMLIRTIIHTTEN